MVQRTNVRRDVEQLPASERRDVLEDLVLTRFREALLMGPDDEVAPDSGFFDLGLTSLRLIEIKERLEECLDISIDTTVVFNQPTVAALVSYLADLLI